MSDAPTPTAETAEAAAPAPRLLLVDDEPGLRTAVQAYLDCLLYTSPSPRD